MDKEYVSGAQEAEGKVEVHLMGTPVVLLDGEKVSFPYQKAEGLFYYLCVNNHITRSRAISVLWADCSEEAARKNLRDAVYNIRRTLGRDILIMEGNTGIILNRERNITIDIECSTKENLLKNGREEFLQFFFVKNCYEFEAWIESERVERRRNYMKALHLKIMGLKAGQELNFLEESGRIFLQNEVMDEEIYRNVMKKLAEAGKHLTAMELYQSLEAFLQKEVGSEPEEETQLLFAEISGMRNSLNSTESGPGEYFFGRTDILYDIYSEICGKEENVRRNYHSFLITGESGVGKSMLLERVKKMVKNSEYLIFDWTCCATEKELYLMPWHGIMSKVNEYCEKNGLEVESPTNILLNQNGEDAQFFMTRFEILTETVFRYLTKYFRDKKILLFIDDIQWMDPMSMRLMSNLLFRMGNGRFIVIASCREDAGEHIRNLKVPLIGRGILKEINLKPFTLAETRKIISDMGSDLEKDLVLSDSIYEKTQGNPLFFMESLHLFEKGDQQGTFTDKMSNVIQGRLLGLSKDERTVLDVISIFSLPVMLCEMNYILEMEDLQLSEILKLLVEKKFICEKLSRGEVSYTFRHQIIREYVYNCLMMEKKKIYHNSIAHFYEEQYREAKDLDTCSLVIYHYEQCGDVYKIYWYKVEYLEAFYRITYDLYPVLARKAVFSRNIDGCYAQEDELVKLAEEIRSVQKKNSRITPILMRVEYLLGRYEMFVADCDKGRECIEKSLKIARELQDRDYMFYNYLQLILYGDLTGQNEFMQDAIETCVNFMKDCTHHHPEEECMLLRYRGMCKVKKGEYQEAEMLYQEAIRRLELEEGKDEKSLKELAACYHNMGNSCILQGEWKEAHRYLELAIETGKRYRISGETGVFYLDMGYVLYHMGEYDKAEEYVLKAKDCFIHVKSLWGEAKVELCSALILEAKGLTEEAQNHRSNSEKLAEKMDSPFLREELEKMEDKKQA